MLVHRADDPAGLCKGLGTRAGDLGKGSPSCREACSRPRQGLPSISSTTLDAMGSSFSPVVQAARNFGKSSLGCRAACTGPRQELPPLSCSTLETPASASPRVVRHARDLGKSFRGRSATRQRYDDLLRLPFGQRSKTLRALPRAPWIAPPAGKAVAGASWSVSRAWQWLAAIANEGEDGIPAFAGNDGVARREDRPRARRECARRRERSPAPGPSHGTGRESLQKIVAPPLLFGRPRAP